MLLRRHKENRMVKAPVEKQVTKPEEQKPVVKKSTKKQEGEAAWQ